MTIRAHDAEPMAIHLVKNNGEHKWTRRMETDGSQRHSLRLCSFCGSLHPEDLIQVISEGATLDVSDWKYGYPHKIYVRGVRNQLAGQIVEIGSEKGPVRDRSGNLVREDFTAFEMTSGHYKRKIVGKASIDVHCKFYTKHFVDDMDDNVRRRLHDAIYDRTRIHLEIKPEGLYFRQEPLAS